MSSQTVSYNVPFGGTTGTIPAGAQNISMTIAGGAGGTGGYDSGGPGGGGGAGRYGSFTLPSSSSARTWALYWGTAGQNGPGGSSAAVGGSGGSNATGSGIGGRGGNDGASGWSGCGAGGGAASLFYLNSSLIVVAGGGGGGGGGSYSCGGSQRPGGGGGTAGGFVNAGVAIQNGFAGANKGGGDGGGGGGGGAGYGAGGGGGAGQDCQYGGGGGGGGGSRYNGSVITLNSQSTNGGNGYGTLSYSVTIAEVVSFSVSPTSIINNGQSATLSWSVVDSQSQSINQGVGAVATSGSINVSPAQSTTYTLTAVGLAGNDSESVTLTVYQPVVANISAQTNPMIVGQSTLLEWIVTGDASTASINQGIGSVLLVSNRTINPATTTTYTISASGPGGTDVDSVTVVVYQRPELSANFPVEINYGDSLVVPVTYRYASNGVAITATYIQRDPNTGNQITTTQNINLAGTASDESGVELTENVTFAVPWTLHGTFGINIVATASGGGGSVSLTPTIAVNVDELPDNITVPDNKDELPLDDVEAPDQETVISDPIVVTDIQVAAEIKSDYPIQVRFDDDDPTIEANWNNVRQIT